MKIEELKQQFQASGYACLIVKDDKEVFSSTARGIFPLVQGISKMKGAYLADKIIGRAAALICVHGGILAVYADIMTPAAAEVFDEYGILFDAGSFVDKIENRDRTGLCPFEELGKELSCPKQALGKVALKLQEFGMELPDDLQLGCEKTCCGKKGEEA